MCRRQLAERSGHLEDVGWSLTSDCVSLRYLPITEVASLARTCSGPALLSVRVPACAMPSSRCDFCLPDSFQAKKHEEELDRPRQPSCTLAVSAPRPLPQV